MTSRDLRELKHRESIDLFPAAAVELPGMLGTGAVRRRSGVHHKRRRQAAENRRA